MKIPVAVKILNEATGPKANVEFMDVSVLENILKILNAYVKIVECHIDVLLGHVCPSKLKLKTKMIYTFFVFHRSSEVRII